MAFNKFSAIILTVCAALIPTIMGTVAPDPKVFFEKRIEGNLTRLTWVHATNSVEKLNAALANDKIMMLEADVVLGTIINATNPEKIPIMGHPPNETSDLSLEMFLNNVTTNGKYGIKLDFKSIEAFEASLPLLKSHHDNLTFPVWLNADILKGPVDATDTPVDATRFLAGAKEYFPESILSIGWTTRFGIQNNPPITSGNYTQQQIQEMQDTLSKSNVTQAVTYPMRAGIVASNTAAQLNNLLEKTAKNKATLTIWSSDDDVVDAKKLSKLIRDVGVKQVYVDVPEKLYKQLQLSQAGHLPAAGVFTVIAMIAANFIINIFYFKY